jgi:hypothetical protein
MNKITKKRTARGTVVALAVIGIVLGATAGACDSSDKKSGQRADTDTLSAVRKAAQTAVPYPVADVKRGGFLERRLLKENLLRQNDPRRLAYVTLLTDQGQIVATYPIQGMVFNLNSQMTTTQQVECHGSDCNSGTALDSIGDNGTFGDEPHSIAFFTTNGVEIKWSGTYLESDAPLDLKSKPLLTYNVNQSPSVNHGGVKTR